MKFCPKCGNLMVPTIIDGRKVLMCRVCRYVEEEPKILEEYTLSKHVEEAKRVRTGKVSEEVSRPLKLKKEEEREILQEYYEIFLETFSEESESGE